MAAAEPTCDVLNRWAEEYLVDAKLHAALDAELDRIKLRNATLMRRLPRERWVQIFRAIGLEEGDLIGLEVTLFGDEGGGFVLPPPLPAICAPTPDTSAGSSSKSAVSQRGGKMEPVAEEMPQRRVTPLQRENYNLSSELYNWPLGDVTSRKQEKDFTVACLREVCVSLSPARSHPPAAMPRHPSHTSEVGMRSIELCAHM